VIGTGESEWILPYLYPLPPLPLSKKEKKRKRRKERAEPCYWQAGVPAGERGKKKGQE